MVEKRELFFTVEGDPFGKERPRASRRGRFVTIYTPKKTIEYEKKVRQSYLNTYTKGDKIQDAVDVEIKAYHSVPKNTPKKKTEKMIRNEIPCTVKPDADNIAKCILDPLNGIGFSDDNHVSRLLIEKRYSLHPRVEVTLKDYIPWVCPLEFYPLEFT